MQMITFMMHGHICAHAIGLVAACGVSKFNNNNNNNYVIQILFIIMYDVTIIMRL